jgi:tetratricopeptide (TPR) repeat protein
MKRNFWILKRQWLILVPVFVFALLQIASPSAAEMNFEKYLKSEKRCGVKSQNLIDAGEYDSAIALLAKGVEKFPSSDWLIGLNGEALYLGGNLEEGEIQFRKALSMNKNNPVAKKYIEEIRKTQDLLEDRELAEWISIAKDKGADLFLLVLGVWFGTLLTLFSERFMGWIKKSSFDKALRKENYDLATDMLENLISEAKKSELKGHLSKMISELSFEKSEEILIEHVYDQDIEEKLLFFLRKIHKNQQLKEA